MDQYTRFWEQVGIIREFFDVAVGPYGTGPDSSVVPTWMAEQGSLLVRGTENVPMALRYARQRTDVEPRQAYGVTWLPIHEDVTKVMQRLADDADFRAASPRLVTPNNLITIAPVNGCPADEPVPTTRPLHPAPAEGDAGMGVDVLVIDTGLVRDFLAGHDWMDGVTGSYRVPLQPHEPLRMYYGHGTFIASVLRCLAPGAKVQVENQLQNAGAICEFDLGQLLLDVLARWQPADGSPTGSRWPDIISLSAGATNHHPREPLMGLAEFIRQLREHPETVLVAAAGNDGQTERFYPAALAPEFAGPEPGLVSVGALREDGKGRACFTNYGDWVSVFVAGERLVSAFATGDYVNEHDATPPCRYYPDPPDHQLYPGCTCQTAGAKDERVSFAGQAQWSGTSFATPIVAGRIATAMRPGETSRHAAGRLLSGGVPIRDSIDGVELPTLRD